MPAASIPAAAQLAPWPASPRSKISTAQPAAASRQPMLNPMTPAPMTATRGMGPEMELKIVVDGCEMAGSLRWYYPDRFRGYDLSRQRAPAPQPWTQSEPAAAILQEVSRKEITGGGSALVAARRLCLRRPAMPHDDGGDILALAQTLGHGRGFVGGAVAAGPNREPVAAIMIAVVGDRHGIALAVELLGELARIRLARERAELNGEARGGRGASHRLLRLRRRDGRGLCRG